MKYVALLPAFLTAAVLGAVLSQAHNDPVYTRYVHRSSSFSSEGGQSSYLFNDGVGRLVQVDTSYENGARRLTIRHNMHVVLDETYTVSSSDFAMHRINDNGRMSFTLLMGDALYDITVDEHHRWRLTKAGTMPRHDAPVPL